MGIRASKDQHMKTDSRETLTAQCVVIVVLLVALVPGYSSGYYVLLRFVICAICAYLAVTAYRSRKLNSDLLT